VQYISAEELWGLFWAT